MSDLHQRQCLNHAAREAVARCPECGHFYCRECIAEHEDRVICASCLRKMLHRSEARRSPALAWLSRGMAFFLSLTVAWMAFYFIGKILLSIPASVHDGTLWRIRFWQE
jgi:uncharacterized paraquat-inducible protein A